MNIYDFLSKMTPEELDGVIETCEQLKNEIEDKEGYLQKFSDPPYREQVKRPGIAAGFYY